MDIASEEMQRLNDLINANTLPGESKGDAFKRLTSPIKPTVNKSNFSAGLGALQQLSIGWCRDAEARSAPPQDEFDIPNHDVIETLLHCSEELDRVIKEINT